MIEPFYKGRRVWCVPNGQNNPFNVISLSSWVLLLITRTPVLFTQNINQFCVPVNLDLSLFRTRSAIILLARNSSSNKHMNCSCKLGQESPLHRRSHHHLQQQPLLLSKRSITGSTSTHVACKQISFLVPNIKLKHLLQ